jgi:D-aminopeptidase
MVRLRDLGVAIGLLPTGANNAITDVPGVLVGHTTLTSDGPRVARTGIALAEAATSAEPGDGVNGP